MREIFDRKFRESVILIAVLGLEVRAVHIRQFFILLKSLNIQTPSLRALTTAKFSTVQLYRFLR